MRPLFLHTSGVLSSFSRVQMLGVMMGQSPAKGISDRQETSSCEAASGPVCLLALSVAMLPGSANSYMLGQSAYHCLLILTQMLLRVHALPPACRRQPRPPKSKLACSLSHQQKRRTPAL
jgi:hypothetical protein